MTETPLSDAAERGEISPALAEQWINERAALRARVEELTTTLSDIHRRCSEFERINMPVGQPARSKKARTIQNCREIAGKALEQGESDGD